MTIASMTIASAEARVRHLFIRDLVLPCRIGVYAHEHGAPQRVRLNFDLGVQEDQPPEERLERVVDYAELLDRVRGAVAAGHVELVETLAERLAALCLEDPRVRSVRVRVEKLDVLPDAASVGVEIERLNPRS
jgi:7,8-dihydroneopterin aldolase/epimerase/oxygenase